MQKKIILSIFASIVIILGSLGIISHLSVSESIQRSLDNQLELANIIGKYFDQLLEDHLDRLSYISFSTAIDFTDRDWLPEEKALRAVHQYSFFTNLIFFLDASGNMVLSYPAQRSGAVSLTGLPAVQKAIHEHKSVISDIHSLSPSGENVILALVPLFKDGNFVGLVGGKIDPYKFIISELFKTIPISKGTIIDLVDSNGIIISSNISQRILTASDHDNFFTSLITHQQATVGRCHRCHVENGISKPDIQDMLAFSPLSIAPWGVTVRQVEETVFAPSIKLKRWFFLLGVVFLFSATLLLFDIRRNFIHPIKLLIQATRRIGQGELSIPVKISSRDEIGLLATSFDEMRLKLSSSLDQIQRDKNELEHRVVERTRDLDLSRKKLSRVLHKVIIAEEEERKRIAKILHDETGQSLNAAMFSLDYLSVALQGNEMVHEKVGRLRTQMQNTVHVVHQMIEDLRPPLLDELGLEYALQWLIERYLTPKNIEVSLNVQGRCAEIITVSDHPVDCSNLEVVLFRITQEAFMNITRYSQAQHVFLSLVFYDTFVELELADDGRGFVVQDVLELKKDSRDITHVGLLAMQERIALLDGRMVICSQPGNGTEIRLFIPFYAQG